MAWNTGDPAPTAALMRRQRIHEEQPIPMNPIAHAAPKNSGSGLGAGGAVVDRGAEITGAVSGWLT
jgi:hypothetical protein